MSSFKQDPNQLSPTFYRVTIDLSGYATADGNDNGAVYTQDHSQFTTKPTTLVNARRVARGHLRFLSIVEEVKKFADAQIMDIEFTSAGATAADNQPTQVKFTVRYDRDAGVFEALNGTNNTAGTPAVIDTVAKAVKELVVQGITRGSTTGYTRRVRVYQPVQTEETDEFITITQPLTLANAHTDVTVTLIDGTTLINP
jgi:hypothetical protein